MAHSGRQAAGGSPGPRADQPDLATSFWNRAGGHLGKPRLHGVFAESSRVARIPGSGAGALWLDAKALHRVILRSSVYRQSCCRNPEAVRADPDNRLLSRFPLRRLDAEAIRDAMLFASGELDDRQGGPYVATDRTGTGDVVVDEKVAGTTRRSVYLQQPALRLRACSRCSTRLRSSAPALAVLPPQSRSSRLVC